MPRDSEFSPNFNKTGQLGNVDSLQQQVMAQPITPHNTIQVDPATTKAGQLATALGVAQKMGADANARDEQAGYAAAAIGNAKTDGSEAYMKGVAKNSLDAGWAVDDHNIREQLQQQPFLNSDDPKQGHADLNNWLNQQLQARYAGIDAESANRLAPKMAQLRADANAFFLDAQAKQVQAKSEADLKTIGGSLLDRSFSPTFPDRPDLGGSFQTEKFDYESLHQAVRAVYPGGSGNAVEAGILSDLAIRKGLPELLQAMPKAWKDGTPSYAGSGDPATENHYREAVAQSERQKQAFLSQAQSATDDAQKAALRASESAITSKRIAGLDVTQDVQRYLQMPGADATKARSIQDWNLSYTEKQTKGLEYTPAALEAQRRAYAGELQSTPDLLAYLASNGIKGAAAGAVAKEALPAIELHNKVDESNPLNRAERDRLGAEYAASRNPITGKYLNDARASQHATALYTYAQGLSNGKTAIEAGNDARKAVGAPVSEMGQTFTVTPAPGSTNAKTQDIQDAQKASITKLDVGSMHRTGVTSETLRSMRSSGQISKQQMEAAAAALAQ